MKVRNIFLKHLLTHVHAGSLKAEQDIVCLSHNLCNVILWCGDVVRRGCMGRGGISPRVLGLGRYQINNQLTHIIYRFIRPWLSRVVM